MEIPYNVQVREDTGVYNSKLGIWLFLASEVMLFGGLFSAYILLRTGAPIWPASYTHRRPHDTEADLVCRLLLEKKKM